MLTIPAPRATRDYLPAEAVARRAVAQAFAKAVASYGFRPIETPSFERVELFSARSGPEIKSSMLTFHCDHEEFALRPELTAPVCRVAAAGGLGETEAQRLFYVGSCFRYCRPQSGRLREFTQAGIELLGDAGPQADAEVIAAACRVLRSVGIDRFRLKIGTVGIFMALLPEELTADERSTVLGHLDRLVSIDEMCALLRESGDALLLDELKVDRMEFVQMQVETGYEGDFSIADRPNLSAEELAEIFPQEAEATLRRWWSVENYVPEQTATLLLRVARLRGKLGDVNDAARALLQGTAANPALDRLIEVCRAVEVYRLGEFEVVLGIARGFTFYTSTVFEISSGLPGGGEKYCGGGRYDSLIEEFGGQPTPAAGFAMRFDALVRAYSTSHDINGAPAFDLVLLGGAAETAPLAEELRDLGMRVGLSAEASAPPSESDCARLNSRWVGAISGAKVTLAGSGGTHECDVSAEQIAAAVEPPASR